MYVTYRMSTGGSELLYKICLTELNVKYNFPNKNNFRSYMIHPQNTFYFKIHILDLIIFGLAV